MSFLRVDKKANRALRNLARGRDCQIRTPDCNYDPETTVLCHLGGAGMGTKHNDFTGGAWGCSSCHDLVDGRVTSKYPRELLKLWHLEGVIRTQETLIAEGKVKIVH